MRHFNHLTLCAVLALIAGGTIFGAGPAAAINVCGDGVCQTTGIPVETYLTCPQDCGGGTGYCGDGACGSGENCSSCLSDCRSSCLSFTLSSELKKSGCAYDDDGDCLDNGAESSLAWLASPWYYYDEDEGCAGASYTQGPNALHYGRQDFVQVRPQGANVSQWQPSSTVKTVVVTYFFLHPHDCRSTLGFGGHQGDSEHIRLKFKSQDLRTWTLVDSEFYHHNGMHNFSGSYLRARASEIGTVYPNVAADEDSHGSWPGRVGSSSDCAGSEDDSCVGTCDCFKGTMASALANGYREVPSGYYNVGGPWPERWRPSVVSVSGSDAYSGLDVGHGWVPEYWTPRTDGWKKFCGWECSSRYTSSGDCAYDVHGESGCSSPLSEKVDYTYFSGAIPFSASLAGDEAADKRAAGRTERLRTAVESIVTALPRSADDDVWVASLLAESTDPLGTVVPLVAGLSPERQLETLLWLLTVPERKAAALVDGVLDTDKHTPAFLEEMATDLVAALAGALEAEGVRPANAVVEAIEAP